MVKYLSLWLFGNLQKPQEVFFFPQEDLLWKDSRVFFAESDSIFKGFQLWVCPDSIGFDLTAGISWGLEIGWCFMFFFRISA